MFNKLSCAVVQKPLTTKGWQAVAAASQSYHCAAKATAVTASNSSMMMMK